PHAAASARAEARPAMGTKGRRRRAMMWAWYPFAGTPACSPALRPSPSKLPLCALEPFVLGLDLAQPPLQLGDARLRVTDRLRLLDERLVLLDECFVEHLAELGSQLARFQQGGGALEEPDPSVLQRQVEAEHVRRPAAGLGKNGHVHGG